MGPTIGKSSSQLRIDVSRDGGLTSSECLLRERRDDEENINRLNCGELPVYETLD
jgi:hypothetical protein